MHIVRPNGDFFDATQVKTDLKQVLTQPGPNELRVCYHCTRVVGNHCLPECPYAPNALSSDPDRYPIEPKVVPIVFWLNSLRLIQTCWSCEGHMNLEGELLRIPQVSFYAISPVHAYLISRHLSQLRIEKKLVCTWQIVLSDYGQNCNVTYTLEPKLGNTTKVHLGLLQKDLQIIGDHLADLVKHLANQMLKNNIGC